MENKKKAISKKPRILKTTLMVLGIILMTAAAAVIIIIYGKLSAIREYVPEAPIAPQDETFETEDQEPAGSAEVVDPDMMVWPADIEQISSPDVINILLIGQDRRPGQIRQRSDSMIILSYSKIGKSAKLISLMRDMYVQIPGYSDNRINAAYQFGGMELLDKTIEKNFGIKIDGNVEVDFEGFISIVDMLGGIDMELTLSEAVHLNNKFEWTLAEGINHLDGKQALEYSRIRYVGNADYERTERQRAVLTYIINNVLEMSLVDQLKTLDAVLPYLTTDMSKQQILGFCYTVWANGLNDIRKYRIPADGAFSPASIRGMSVLVPELEKNQELLKAYILD